MFRNQVVKENFLECSHIVGVKKAIRKVYESLYMFICSLTKNCSFESEHLFIGLVCGVVCVHSIDQWFKIKLII